MKTELLRPSDRQFIASLDYAMPLVVRKDPGAYPVDLYRVFVAVNDLLGDAGRQTIPLGAFVRLVRAAGYDLRVNRESGTKHLHSVRLVANG